MSWTSRRCGTGIRWDLLALACLALVGCGENGDSEGDLAQAGTAGPASGTQAGASGQSVGQAGSAGRGAGGMQPAAGTNAAPTDPPPPDTEASLGDDPTHVALADGELQGDVVGGSVRFLKIPYAKPPVGDLRWSAPVDNDPWEGVRHEQGFGSPCPQPPSQQSPASDNEDCLYLNVWRPNNVESGAPVMVWIHGGGFTTGWAGDNVPTTLDHLWYDGQVFAERGIVVVTLNYRLGVFGFFAHPQLAGEGAPVGNQGLLDQRQALMWVQDNIAAFGGDPNNVTIFGESAGAGSVCMHIVSPGSRGLFHRAVGQSGGCARRRTADPDTLNAQIAEFAASRGCEGDDTLACLRQLPVSELVSMDAVDRTMGSDALRESFSFGAVIDGEGGFLPEPAIDFFDRGDVADVPYIIGTNHEESQLYNALNASVPTDEQAYVAAITELYGDFADRVLEMYPVSKFGGDARQAFIRVATDSGNVCGTLDTARAAFGAGMDVYMYNFNVVWSIVAGIFGASHASEIGHVFGTPYLPTPESATIAEAMNAYWASFAEDGDPNFDGAAVQWPLFAPDANDDDQRIEFGPNEVTVVSSFRKEECQLWREYAAQ